MKLNYLSTFFLSVHEKWNLNNHKWHFEFINYCQITFSNDVYSRAIVYIFISQHLFIMMSLCVKPASLIHVFDQFFFEKKNKFSWNVQNTHICERWKETTNTNGRGCSVFFFKSNDLSDVWNISLLINRFGFKHGVRQYKYSEPFLTCYLKRPKIEM